MSERPHVVVTDLSQKQAHISVQRYFEISLLLMLATGFLTVATTGKLDLVSMVGMFGALVIKLWSYVREADYSLSPKTVTRISIFYIFFYGLDFLIFSSGPSPLDRMLSATVHLVLFTAVMKIFSARTYRDYGYLATLSFLMMLASAVLTVGTTFLVFFTLYVLFAISTFISYEIKRAVEAAWRSRGTFPCGRAESPGHGKSADDGGGRLGRGNHPSGRRALFRHSPVSDGLPDRPFHAGPEHHGLFRIRQSGRYPQDPALTPGGDAGDAGGESPPVRGRQVAGRQSEQF